ncbi:trypsin-like peptidase domain-containing protein [Sediminicoccus sp. BL-A-41-H5]|uniref:trypsin-like peptidase domain-containing protein n=1 Tax=Sediminicoccus sp. BL-A-41-H5 TaxID=3421106 RepID=UPI003D67B22B
MAGQEISTATGFFWHAADGFYLISNWHVFSGRHTKTFQPLDKSHSTIPDEIFYPRFISNADPTQIEWYSISVNTLSPSHANWLEHPVFGSDVDIGAIKIADRRDFFGNSGLKTVIWEAGGVRGTLSKELISGFQYFGPRREMGDDLFVIGFPFGMNQTDHFPIWKRASVASEMDFLIGGKPAFLIDTAGRPGMSGSPVIFVEPMEPVSIGLVRSRKATFMGIYSGRHVGERDFEAQLGIVWREELINEVVEGGKQAPTTLAELEREAVTRGERR